MSNKVLLGLIGAGIQKSLTPAMQEQEAAHHGLRLHYQLIELESPGANPADLPVLLKSAQTMGFAGLNITFPCKQAVVGLLDDLSADARAMNAVNTVVFKDGKATGHNTDSSGWAWGFQRTLPEADLSRVVLLGAGGAGSAIAHALGNIGCEHLSVVDADLDKAKSLAKDVSIRFGIQAQGVSEAQSVVPYASGLVHATPTGMVKMPGLPLNEDLIRKDLWVSEVVYFPMETALLALARERGCAVVDGGTMAVGQAVGAFELFTGRKADVARMNAHFRSMVAGGV